jgi:hypothetical protein
MHICTCVLWGGAGGGGTRAVTPSIWSTQTCGLKSGFRDVLRCVKKTTAVFGDRRMLAARSAFGGKHRRYCTDRL